MKETQKQLITRLEKELHEAKNEIKEYKTLCSKLNTEILEMRAWIKQCSIMKLFIN